MKKILNTIKRKRKDAALFAGAAAVYALIVPGILLAANSFPGSLNNWNPGDTIESDWANALEDKIGADNSSVQTSLDWLVSTNTNMTATGTLRAGGNGGATDLVFKADADTGRVSIGTTTVDALTTLFVAPTSTDATSVAKFTNSAGTSVFNITPSSGVEIDDKWVLDAQTQNNIEALRFTGTGVNDIAEAIFEAKGSGNGARLSVTADSAAQTGISIQDDGTDVILESFKRGGGTLHNLKFSIDGTSTTTYDTDGDFGINTTNPTSTLQVSGGDVHFQGANGTPGLYWDTSTSRLGINTTSPGYNVEINGGSNNNLAVTSANTNSQVGIRLINDAQQWRIRNNGGASDKFQIRDVTNTTNPFSISPGAATDALTIDANGNIVVGTALRLPNGTGPTVDAAGEIAIDTTSGQLVWHDGNEKKQISDTYDKSFFGIASTTPDANGRTFETGTSTYTIWVPTDDVTFNSFHARTNTGTAIVRFGKNGSFTDELVVDSNGATTTNPTTSAFPSGSQVQVEIGSCSSCGGIDNFTANIEDTAQ